MRSFHLSVHSLFFVLPLAVCFAGDLTLTASKQDEMIIIRIDKQTFTCYRYGDGQKYPYFFPVNGPLTGESLTTESSLPYPHHRSLFFGCDYVNDDDYWHGGNDLGQIISNGPKILKDGPDEVVILDECNWRKPGQKSIIRDHREIRIFALSDSLRIIDFNITVTAMTDVNIQKTSHSLFSARMKEQLSVNQGGVLRNAADQIGEKQTFGQNAAWSDYSGNHFGFVEGLAIFDSPSNPWFPSKWFTRDYGFFSPTNLYWIDENGFQLKESETLQVSYRVIVHAGDSDEIQMAELFSDWISIKGSQ